MKTAAMLLPLLLVCSLGCATAHNRALSDASTKFAKDMLSTLSESEKGNVIVSPISISTLLAMLQQGARNNSSVQIEEVLHIDPANSRDGYGNLVQTFTKRKYKSKLEFNNNIFASHSFGINPNFTSILHTSFNAGIEKLDFNNPNEASKRINEWVAYWTKNRITDLVKPGVLSSRTQMVLANTIYFKGVWRETFPIEHTTEEDFTTGSGKKVKVQMMTLKTLLRGGSDDALGAKWVELPYDGFDFSMILVLPNETRTIDQVIRSMNHGSLSNIMSHLYTQDVTLRMPRLKLSQEVPVVPALKKLGLVDIFDQRSNLRGISSSGATLLVSDIVHKAEIEVNEAGTEASAGSAVYVNTLSAIPDYEVVTFVANRPFLAIVVDSENKLPLFVARVENPNQQ